MTTPIFIISLPRSGSTILQKEISKHKEISTFSESWIIFNFLNFSNSITSYSNYGNRSMQLAFQEIFSKSNLNEEELKKILAKSITDCYKKLSSNNKFFIDKTPRYHLIINQIEELFPEGIYIYLYRNPIDIFISFIEYFCNGNFYKYYSNNIDLVYGFNNISKSYKNFKQNKILINYENFIKDSLSSLDKIYNYLAVNPNKKDNGDDFMNNFYGDQIANKSSKVFNNVSKLEDFISSYQRKKILYKFIKNIDNDYLIQGGYNKKLLLNKISNIKTYKLFHIIDVINLTASYISVSLNLNMLKKRKSFDIHFK